MGKNRGPKPTRFERFDITVTGPPRLVVVKEGRDAKLAHIDARPKYSIEAVVTIRVKKLVTAAKLNWSFVGKEYARSPAAASRKCEHLIVKSSGKILTDDTALHPGQVYTFPISATIPGNALPSFHSEFAGVRYVLTATLHRQIKKRLWLLGRSPQVYSIDQEVHVPKIFIASPAERGPRVYGKMGSSTVAITAPAYIALDSSRRPQIVTLTIDIIAGPAKLKAADVKLFEKIPLADEVFQPPKSKNPVPDVVLTPEDLQQRALIHLTKDTTPIASNAGTVVNIQLPADAFDTWRDDVDSSKFFGCQHWFQLQLEGKEWLLPVKAGKKEPLMVPIAIHGSMSCHGSSFQPPPPPPPPPLRLDSGIEYAQIESAPLPPQYYNGEASSSTHGPSPPAFQHDDSGKHDFSDKEKS
ncbi:hypothetical protein HDU87_007330 [Geranomyces variabilis]|uniref:Uncharacterized protein n=1 Tax=Geranomyces variabilis TaxID=109894 RepID=A0AAD5TJF9_9FUNG|nr:hypothetical protein HDU87_007330 [Geranomyces variabilis]